MTVQQLERIAELRALNYPYSFIGRALGLPSNTKTKAEKYSAQLCKNCHRLLPEAGRKDRQFCSDECRIEWWKNNRKVIEKYR